MKAIIFLLLAIYISAYIDDDDDEIEISSYEKPKHKEEPIRKVSMDSPEEVIKREIHHILANEVVICSYNRMSNKNKNELSRFILAS